MTGWGKMPHSLQDMRQWNFEEYHAIGYLKKLARSEPTEDLGRDEFRVSYGELMDRYGWGKRRAQWFMEKCVRAGILFAYPYAYQARTPKPKKYRLMDTGQRTPRVQKRVVTTKERKNEKTLLHVQPLSIQPQPAPAAAPVEGAADALVHIAARKAEAPERPKKPRRERCTRQEGMEYLADEERKREAAEADQ